MKKRIALVAGLVAGSIYLSLSMQKTNPVTVALAPAAVASSGQSQMEDTSAWPREASHASLRHSVPVTSMAKSPSPASSTTTVQSATTLPAPATATFNGEPCSQCTAGDGHTCDTGCDPSGNPLPPDPAVTVAYPDGIHCGRTDQSEADANGYTVIPASQCDAGFVARPASSSQPVHSS